MGILKNLYYGAAIINGLKNSSSTQKNENAKTNSRSYYCVYCGKKFNSVQALTMAYCTLHPAGSLKGKHKLYEGTEKSQYICKYCGQKFSTLSSLTMANCNRHPNGCFKGKHSPAL